MMKELRNVNFSNLLEDLTLIQKVLKMKMQYRMEEQRLEKQC